MHKMLSLGESLANRMSTGSCATKMRPSGAAQTTLGCSSCGTRAMTSTFQSGGHLGSAGSGAANEKCAIKKVTAPNKYGSFMFMSRPGIEVNGRIPELIIQGNCLTSPALTFVSSNAFG